MGTLCFHRSAASEGSRAVPDPRLDQTRRDIGLTQRVSAYPSPGALALMNQIRTIVAASADFQAAA